MWGVGSKTAERLAAPGIRTTGDIVAQPAVALVREFGKHGCDLAQHACGVDERPVMTERVARSISTETTFVRDVPDWEPLWQTVQSSSAGCA